MITKDENGDIILTIGVEPWNGEEPIQTGDYVGKYKHVGLHAVNKVYYRMQTKENLAYGLKSKPYATMKLPNYKGAWVDLIERYPIGKVITLDKVRFEIHKVDVSLPVEAFDGNPTECEDYFLDVYFKLEGTKADPSIIQIVL